MEGGSRKAILAAFFANLGIAIAKIIGFMFTGAASMLAETIHSIADASNQGLLILGGKMAKKERSKEHPFGYGRERYFWAFIVAMIIFSLGSLFAIYEGIDKLLHPHALNDHFWAIGILSIAIVLELFSLRTAVIESKKIKGKMTWWQFIRKSKVPELPVVLLEDIGALIGLVLALGGIGLAMITGNAAYDAIGSLSIGILLGIIAIILGTEMRSLLLGESASEENIQKLKNIISQHPDVCKLIHMRTEHIGPEELLVAVKVELSGELDTGGVARAINSLEESMRSQVDIKLTIYIEPDIYEGGACPVK